MRKQFTVGHDSEACMSSLACRGRVSLLLSQAQTPQEAAGEVLMWVIRAVHNGVGDLTSSLRNVVKTPKEDLEPIHGKLLTSLSVYRRL
jgi:hypothetical protein